MPPTMLVLSVITLYLVAIVVSDPLDEFRLMHQGEIAYDENKFLMQIVPSGFSPHAHESKKVDEVLNTNNTYYKNFYKYVKNGITAKGRTFTVYDDDMRKAAIALFRLFQQVEQDDYEKIYDWSVLNINNDILRYAEKLNYLYSYKLNRNKISLNPCYIEKPNYFINSETIIKAMKLRLVMSNRNVLPPEAAEHQYYQDHGFISINTNYSGWNLVYNGDDQGINYFREDISLNCYYMGVHLLHPFWMSNDELDLLNLRHAEHFFNTHQQLVARYNLEKQHLLHMNHSYPNETEYDPSLIYDNGLRFPIRYINYELDWTDERAEAEGVWINIRKCIERGFIVMDGITLNMNNDDHVSIMAKLIKSNLDNARMAKILREIFGNMRNRHPIDEYNPAPSVFYHPETSLRDPTFWKMIEYYLNVMKYFRHFMDPFLMEEYTTEDFNITGANFTKMETFFEYYRIPLNKILSAETGYISRKWPMFARQRRINHSPLTLNFTVDSKIDKNVIVRLFLGPNCSFNNCWERFEEFYELDIFNFTLHTGLNVISWNPHKSKKYSYFKDDISQHYFHNYDYKKSARKGTKFNLFKFPGNLAIPRGLESGLNFKLAIIITPSENSSVMDHAPEVNYYKQVSYEYDTKPLGFPFHRNSGFQNSLASNYRLFDIKIYHRKSDVDESGYFSSNLY
ncbi:hexamerin-1.1-like [Bombyx mandarina]|uniref:Uncharacterized protein n=3 Tax=Bombyx TaxID=7090 RepID=A0A8R2APS8_BOMMO|nr:hexamerin-1.1 [Bombyx mori]XP_028041696.1 hexamerin-1.1-like [Bombyx mandarina]